MELSNEERAELNQLGRKRWNWTGVLLLGVALLVAGAVSASSGGQAGAVVIGLAVAVGGGVMRGRVQDRINLVEARIQDRVGRVS